MIREFSVKPKPSNNKARLAFVACMSLSFLFILISTLMDSYKGIVSLLGVTLLICATVLYTKYISPVWFYDITFDSDGSAVLVVRQQIGKRHTTLCRIGLSEILKVEKESANDRHSHRTPSGYTKYSYMPTLDPKESYRLTTSSRYERAEILIESSEGFADLLAAYSAEARKLEEMKDEY